MVRDCIFCKIVRGEIPCHEVYEDDEFLAFLDIHPNTEGMTLVLPKKHYPSYTVDMPEDAYAELMKVSKKLCQQIDKNLGVKRTAIIMEGMGIDHAHIKLYPLHGLTEKFKETWEDKTIFFKKYEGYISTLLGPKEDDKTLAAIAKKIRGN